MTADDPGTIRFTVRYDAGMVRRAVALFMWRRVFRTGGFAMAALLVATLAAVGAAGVAAAASLVAAAFLGMLLACLTGVTWRAHLEASLGRLRTMSPPEAEITADDARLAFRSSLGDASLPWTRFTETWRTPDFWMLFTSPSGFNVLPMAGAPPAALALLDRRLPPERR